MTQRITSAFSKKTKSLQLCILMIFCCLVNINTLSGQGFVDSVLNVTQTATSDSLRFRAFDELAWTQKNRSPQKALSWADSAIRYGEKLGVSYEGIAIKTRAVIKSENRIDDYGSADYNRVIDISIQLNDSLRLASTYNNLSDLYMDIGKYEDAIATKQKALAIYRDAGSNYKEMQTLNGIGLVYQRMDLFEQALTYFDQAEKALGSNPDYDDLRGLYNNMGLAFQGKNELNKALIYFKKAIVGYDEEKYGNRIALTNGNIAIALWRLGKLDSAVYYGKSSVRLKLKAGDSSSVAYPAITLAKILDDQGKYEEALEFANLGIIASRKSASLKNMMESYRIKGEVEFNLKQFENSAYSYLGAYSLNDSLNKLSLNEKIAEMDAAYQVQRAQSLSNELQTKAELDASTIKIQKILIAGVLLILLLIALLAAYYFKTNKVQKKLIAEVRQQKDQIEQQASKLRELDTAKSNFFSNISHDLRSPLTLILGGIDSVLEDNGSTITKGSQDMLEGSYRNSKKLLFMADEIRDLTRLQEGKMILKLRKVKVAPYISLLVKMFNSAASFKRISLKFQSDIDPNTVVSIDPHQFEKVIYNLLSNAVKHTQAEGTISVVLKNDHSNDSDILISIEDTGQGMPNDMIPHIFDRYFQIKQNAQGETIGLGIGLALAKEILESHGAAITVSSEEEKGSEFVISLSKDSIEGNESAVIDEYYDPLRSPVELMPDVDLEVALGKKDKSILVVEDHRDIRNYMVNLLSSEYNVATAKNGEEALIYLQKNKADLVISDLMMPFMDGFELVKNLKSNENYDQLPLLIVSARTNEEDKIRILELGADEIIAKPFSPKELRFRIQNMLSKKSGTSKLLELFEPKASQDGLEQIIAKKLETLILEHIDDPNLGIYNFSDALAASERKVFRLVKRIFEMTPLDLIKETRWKYLETVIKSGQKLSATEAGKAIGMTNVTYFKKQFAEKFNMSFDEYCASIITK